MVKTAPRNVTIVKTTPPVPYKVRNVIPLAVLTLVISPLHVKVNNLRKINYIALKKNFKSQEMLL